ncbi:MAG: hypothetical protein J6L92_00955, partial [Clostridia bacterium]|nr:hypothetical protein [Clostridia bacterium]
GAWKGTSQSLVSDVIVAVCAFVMISATEPYCLFPPNIVGMATRPVIGIVTKCDHKFAQPEAARLWLENCGCEKIFFTSSYDNKGIEEIIDYLK